MKFVTFAFNDAVPRAGALAENRVHDLSGEFANMLALLAAEPGNVQTALGRVQAKGGTPLSDVRLLAPIPRPPRLFCIGLNYATHAAETQMKVQAVPTVFMKLASSVTGPDTAVVLPYNSTEPDYEAELAVVIGKPGYRIKAVDWEQHVFGYTILNDVSARDIQLATSQWTLGKSYPTFAPMGPAITSREEILDPHNLPIRLAIDGEVLQDSNTADLLFRIPQLIEYISAYTPLETGDLISTGTPEGVGLGRTPKRWIRDGEEMVITIEGLGELRNRATREPGPSPKP